MSRALLGKNINLFINGRNNLQQDGLVANLGKEIQKANVISANHELCTCL